MRHSSRATRALAALTLVLVLSACGGASRHLQTPTATLVVIKPTAVPNATAEMSGAALLTIQSPVTAAGSLSPVATTIFSWPSSSANQFDADGDGFLTWDEYKLAVAAAFNTFTWPPSYIVTPQIILAHWPNADHTSQFQVGFELNNISIWLDCAWERTWLDSRQSGDTALEAEALSFIVTAMPEQFSDDYSRSAAQEIGAKASIGDPSGVIQQVNANCTRLDLKKVDQ